jgi:hypothetical protein
MTDLGGCAVAPESDRENEDDPTLIGSTAPPG